MTLNVDRYWRSNKDWYYVDDEGYHLKDDAPPEAQKVMNNI